MKEMINFGIDLGTSNSLIARFNAGRVEVFKNPRGHKESLPSVVGFRADKILVGDKAREYLEKDSKNVASRFKRKMGTSETIKIESLNSSKTPIELSAFVLKELKEFIHSGQIVDAAVITIPASFDTIQSNATKEAGIQAGFNEVILLQEPIAASLAYANQDNSQELKNSQWIVYDLGGGTFDVALVKIIEGELNVVDHEGDNYFGGADLDELIVEKIIVPAIEKQGEFTDLIKEMKSATGRYNRDWYVLLKRAEEAKIELSSDQSAEIEYTIENSIGNEIDVSITITRSEFEALIKDKITDTTKMLKNILTRQSLQPKDLEFVLMVGGSTYIPFVRKHVEEIMGISVNTNIDPTNAIAVGAAYYAGSKQKKLDNSDDAPVRKYEIKVRATYERNTQEEEEMFSARIDGNIAGMTYRIHSADGAFDSGAKALKSRITEDLPLRIGEYNIFEFQVRDDHGTVVETGLTQIQIAQGRYSIAGQMLPDELSLVMDDPKTNNTRLESLFNKNSILPTIAKKTVEVGKTVVKNSSDEVIRIMVVEGSSANHYLCNKPLGALIISGEMISRDLLKGTEIDITFELSESRDLTISAYLNGTGQDFSQVFNPQLREVIPVDLGSDILHLEEMIQGEKREASKNNNPEVVKQLEKVLSEVQMLMLETGKLTEDDVSDTKFKLETEKRTLAQKAYRITSSKRVDMAISDYREVKNVVSQLVKENGNDSENHQLREIIGREEVFLHSNNPLSIENESSRFYALRYQIYMRMPEFLIGSFEHLVENRVSMNDQVQTKQLIENGKNLIEKESWEDLRIVISRLWDLMPETERTNEDYKLFTGII
jgi:molecular chaperone DnaK